MRDLKQNADRAQKAADRAFELVRDLPLGASSIASFFEAEGVKGRPNDACRCPLANYLTSKLRAEGHRFISVATFHNVFVDNRMGGRLAEANPSAQEFICRFDNREFSQLIDRAAQ